MWHFSGLEESGGQAFIQVDETTKPFNLQAIACQERKIDNDRRVEVSNHGEIPVLIRPPAPAGNR
ncbi:hypothetical protein N9C58_00140 [bacterium]|nr:hypothetical protein [bacterium]